MSVQRSIRVADTFYIGELIVVEVRLGPLRRAEMDKDRPDAARMNFLTNFRDVIQGLPAKRASKVTKEDQQGWRRVDKLKQNEHVIDSVCNPGLRDRHWALINQTLQTGADPVSDSNSLLDLLARGIAKQTEKYHQHR